jgi:hypothetical protein
VSSVLVAGLGEVGVRTARQLLDTPGVERVYVAARDADQSRTVASALHDGATPWELDHHRPSFPDGLTVVAAAMPGAADVELARAAVAAGVSYASAADDAGAVAELLALDADARRAGVRIAVGCGLAPGLGDVLARHAASALDTVDELHVARWGVAGDACVESARRAHREPGLEWRDGAFVEDRAHGTELVWFPDPVGARECRLVATGVDLLVAANPGVVRATMRVGGLPGSGGRVRRALTPPPRRDQGANWGSVRVEAWGTRGVARDALVYGVIEQPAVAAGTVLGVTAACLAGAVDGVIATEPGAFGLGAVVTPAPFLAELAKRGVKAAAFEGAVVT